MGIGWSFTSDLHLLLTSDLPGLRVLHLQQCIDPERDSGWKKHFLSNGSDVCCGWNPPWLPYPPYRISTSPPFSFCSAFLMLLLGTVIFKCHLRRGLGFFKHLNVSFLINVRNIRFCLGGNFPPFFQKTVTNSGTCIFNSCIKHFIGRASLESVRSQINEQTLVKPAG